MEGQLRRRWRWKVRERVEVEIREGVWNSDGRSKKN